MSGVDPVPLGLVPDLDPALVRPAQLACARLAVRHGATPDELRLVLAALGLIADDTPSAVRYTPEGRRVRPGRAPKAAGVPEPRPTPENPAETRTAPKEAT